MYWSIQYSKEKIVKSLRKNFHAVSTDVEGDDILVFRFNGGKPSLNYYYIIFSTYCFKSDDEEIKNANRITRVIKCESEERARLIAKAMLGEEVYVSEYLHTIIEIRLATEEEIKKAVSHEYAIRKLAEEIGWEVVEEDGRVIGIHPQAIGIHPRK